MDKHINNSRLPNAPIMREYLGFIILAQSESDYQVKCRKIREGDRRGFYKLEDFPNHPNVIYTTDEKTRNNQ